MNKVLCKCIFVICILYSTQAFSGELTVAVAANVQYAFEELKVMFEQDTGIQIVSVFGSSGKLTSQIEHGAPFDVFIAADMDFLQLLASKQLVLSNPRVYAYGTLVLWTKRDVDVSQGIGILSQSDIKKIAIANPQTAPYGRQAVNALERSHLFSLIEKKLVYGDSIAQVNHFVATQSVDFGITSKSSVLAPHLMHQGQWVDIDKSHYTPIAQGIIILKHAQKKNLDNAQKFIDFIFSKSARDIFEKYGYELP